MFLANATSLPSATTTTTIKTRRFKPSAFSFSCNSVIFICGNTSTVQTLPLINSTLSSFIAMIAMASQTSQIFQLETHESLQTFLPCQAMIGGSTGKTLNQVPCLSKINSPGCWFKLHCIFHSISRESSCIGHPFLRYPYNPLSPK